MRFIAANSDESRINIDVYGVRMSVLKIIALLILAGSLVTFIVQCVKGKARSSILFIATAILSIVLFALAGHVENMADADIVAYSPSTPEEVQKPSADGQTDPVGQADAAAEGQDAGSADAAGNNNFDFADDDSENAPAADGEAPSDAVAAAEAPANAETAAAEAPANAETAAAEAPANAEAATAEAPANAEAAAAEAPAEAPAAEAPAEAPAAEAPAEAPAAEAPAEAPAAEAPAEAAAAEAPAEAAAAPAEAPAAEAPAVIENDPLAPTAIAGDHVADAKVKEAIAFDGSHSRKKKAAIKTYHWDFGDGATADTVKAHHAYAAVGSYVATLTIVDADGHTATATRKIDITRPEAKIRFTQNVKKIDDVVSSSSAPSDVTGKATKSFEGSNMTLEAKATVESTAGCTCNIQVTLTGPGCHATHAKKVSDGGEGNLTAKAACKGQAGEYTWSFKRTNSGACTCTWTDVKLDGYEN